MRSKKLLLIINLLENLFSRAPVREKKLPVSWHILSEIKEINSLLHYPGIETCQDV